jgi:hypothetical protein
MNDEPVKNLNKFAVANFKLQFLISLWQIEPFQEKPRATIPDISSMILSGTPRVFVTTPRRMGWT